jgi:hypothetical protein
MPGPSVSNAVFTVNQSKIFQGPGRCFYDWFVPAAGGQTIVDGSTPAQLVVPSSLPVYQTAYAYNIDDQFVDGNNNMQRVIGSPVPGVTTSQATAPVWSSKLFGITTDTSGISYMCLGACGVPLGSPEGAMEIDIADATVDVAHDVTRAPLVRFATGTKASIAVTLQQLEADLMARALAAAQYTTGTNALYPTGAQTYNMITFGGVNAPLVPKVCVVAVLQRPGYASPSKNHIITLYGACIDPAGLKPQAQLSKHSTYKIKFDGMTVFSRADYDQIGQWVEQP